MDIDVTVTRDELAGWLEELAPIRIHLDDLDETERWLELERPVLVELVPGVGVRLVTSGRLRYALAGFEIPATIRKLVLMLIPEVIPASSSLQSLAFRLEIEDGDLVRVPAFVDQALVRRVNSALTPETTRMIWHFGQSLARNIALSERLEPLDSLRLSVVGGAVGIDDQRICFSVRLGLAVERSSARPGRDAG
jgi:hypothetical protein